MRLFALQSIGKLTKEFTLNDEKIFLMTTKHPLIFLFGFARGTAMLLLMAFAITAAGSIVNVPGGILLPVFSAISVAYILIVIKAYIDWKFNALIVTNEKVVIIRQIFFFFQNIVPIHLDNIVSTRSETQFFGIWRCGIVQLALQERERVGSTRRVTISYLPKPEIIASTIEQAITLFREKAMEDTKMEQRPKISEVKKKVSEQLPDATVVQATPSAGIPQVSEIPK